MRQSMLTTTDNPFDPFTQFDEWFTYDTRQGHNTSSFLARLTFVSYDLSEADQNFAIESAIDEIVSENINGLYKKVTREVPDDVKV